MTLLPWDDFRDRQKRGPDTKWHYEAVEREAEYTRHAGTIHYMDGDSESAEWDYTDVKDGVMVFGDFHDANESGFVRKITKTVPIRNLRNVDTEDRWTESIEYETTVRRPHRPGSDDYRP